MFHFTPSHALIVVVIYLVRLILAVAFIFEVNIKLKDIRGFAKNDSLPLPLAYGVTIAELAAAISFLTGVLTQLAAIGVVLLMLSTLCLHLFKWHSPYRASKGGWEYDLMLLAFAAVLVVSL